MLQLEVEFLVWVWATNTGINRFPVYKRKFLEGTKQYRESIDGTGLRTEANKQHHMMHHNSRKDNKETLLFYKWTLQISTLLISSLFDFTPIFRQKWQQKEEK